MAQVILKGIASTWVADADDSQTGDQPGHQEGEDFIGYLATDADDVVAFGRWYPHATDQDGTRVKAS